jgi:hypothetical protein
MTGPCDQTAGCVYPVGQAGPGAAALSISLPMVVHVAPRRITLPGGSDTTHEVCMDFEPWFTKLNVPRWEGRAGASGLPLVGDYSSFHPGVIRQHAIWLTEAGVSCVNVDWSNMLWTKIPWSARGPNVYELTNSTASVLREHAALRAEGHGPGPPGAVKRPHAAFSDINRVSMALLYGRAGRLTAKNGGFRPGQTRRVC